MGTEVKWTISRWTTIVALSYMMAAFFRVLPYAPKEIQPEHVPYGCMDYPNCFIYSGTSVPELDTRHADIDDIRWTNESLLIIEKKLDMDMKLREAYARKSKNHIRLKNKRNKQKDPQALTSKSQPHRRFRREAFEFHFEMEPVRETDDEQHYPHGHGHSHVEWVLEPYEGPGLCLALRVTFVISSSLLGLSLLFGKDCGGPIFFRRWLVAAGASTALDVGLLIAVAVTEGTNDCTIFHYVFLVMRVFSFCIVYNRMISFEITRRGDTRPILPQRINGDDGLRIV